MPAFATFALATTLSAFTTPSVEIGAGPPAARARAWEQAAAGPDTQAIARALGREGQLIGDVYRVSLPRSDLAVTVRGVTVRPGLALGSWMAFRPAGGAVLGSGRAGAGHESAGPGGDPRGHRHRVCSHGRSSRAVWATNSESMQANSLRPHRCRCRCLDSIPPQSDPHECREARSGTHPVYDHRSLEYCRSPR